MKTPIKHKILLQVNQKLNYEHVSTTKPLYNGQVLAWYRKNFLNRRQDGRHETRVIYDEGNSKCHSGDADYSLRMARSDSYLV